ncbi:MAG: hypothetical protein JW809_11365 [Pirellulales bacterium]|nr:hypothetical protein [Pirellulales bacterium]
MKHAWSPGRRAIATALTLALWFALAVPSEAAWTLVCREDNDLHRVMADGGLAPVRCAAAAEAIRVAPEGSGVLILADGYPDTTTAFSRELLQQAGEKRLRLFLEYPGWLPDVAVGKTRGVSLERVVAATDVFGPALARLSILAVHDCHYVPVAAPAADLVVGRVAGLDRAVFGLEDVETAPILFVHPRGDLMVSTTKLSQFVTARYATKDAMQAVWRHVLGWLQPDAPAPTLDWTPTVRPTYGPKDALPPDAVRRAIQRGIDWHTRARMLVHADWKDKYDEYRRASVVDPRQPVGSAPDSSWPAGDGSHGVLEGVASRIRFDGTQPIRWSLRCDSNGETALAFALRARLDGDPRSRQIAENLLDWLYFDSGLFDPNPSRPTGGTLRWTPDSGALYADNDIKAILGGIGTAALLETDQWDEVLLKNILGNFRTTGPEGFRYRAIHANRLTKLGWEHFWRDPYVCLAPHYEAWIWASYLWLFDKTHEPILLERTRRGIRRMMEAYPDGWRWTNGIQQERGRMLLALAWLIRVEDRPEYRAWLRRLAQDMRKCQDASGAIREELGQLAQGAYRPPQSNAEYGKHEAALIQANGEPVADLLYTCNFTLLGLHEAHAATGEPLYREMADRLAEFLVRVQVRSEAHQELDGGWFRAFDYRRWDYWGSNADRGWGAWAIEVGWTQGWIPTGLALRELDLNLWDLTAGSRIARHWPEVRKAMLPREDNPP